MHKILLILAIFHPRGAIFTVLELFTCANHPPLKYCTAIGRHNMARIPVVHISISCSFLSPDKTIRQKIKQKNQQKNQYNHLCLINLSFYLVFDIVNNNPMYFRRSLSFLFVNNTILEESNIQSSFAASCTAPFLLGSKLACTRL